MLVGRQFSLEMYSWRGCFRDEDGKVSWWFYSGFKELCFWIAMDVNGMIDCLAVYSGFKEDFYRLHVGKEGQQY